MDIAALLVDITSHLNELNLKMQNKDSLFCPYGLRDSFSLRKVDLYTLTMFDATYSG